MIFVGVYVYGDSVRNRYSAVGKDDLWFSGVWYTAYIYIDRTVLVSMTL